MSASRCDTVRWDMIEAGGRAVQSFGVPRLLGQIYVLLYLSPEPMGLDDMASHLGVSKASISISCRQLAAWGAIKSVWIRGSRRDFYTAEVDARRLIGGGLVATISQKLDSARGHIEQSLRALEGAKAEGQAVAFMRERLEAAERRRAALDKVLKSSLLKHLM